jgi:hypothetical protein
VPQQYESFAHTFETHESQDFVNLVPVVHLSCEHVDVLPWQVPSVPQVFPLEQVPQEPPQPSSPQVLPEQLGVQLETH